MIRLVAAAWFSRGRMRQSQSFIYIFKADKCFVLLRDSRHSIEMLWIAKICWDTELCDFKAGVKRTRVNTHKYGYCTLLHAFNDNMKMTPDWSPAKAQLCKQKPQTAAPSSVLFVDNKYTPVPSRGWFNVLNEYSGAVWLDSQKWAGTCIYCKCQLE